MPERSEAFWLGYTAFIEGFAFDPMESSDWKMGWNWALANYS